MSQPRGSSGATSRAAISASNEKDEKSGAAAAPVQSLRLSRATCSPVARSNPGVGLISTCAIVSRERSSFAASSKLGIGSA